MIEEIKKELKESSDEKYQKFSSALIPNIDNILGVRTPLLRKLAKRISKEDFELFFKENNDEYMELTLLEGFIIGLLPYSKQINYIEKYIKKINNWAVCDGFCASLKNYKTNKKDLKKLIEKYYQSKDEYINRFCYVMMTFYLIDDDLEYVLNKVEKFNNELYYAKMAAAWCLSICIINHFELMFEKLSELNIENWVLKKGITKAIESLKLSKEQKSKLKKFRANLS